MLSDYYKKIKDINNISVGKVKNFDANSYDKERYSCIAKTCIFI